MTEKLQERVGAIFAGSIRLHEQSAEQLTDRIVLAACQVAARIRGGGRIYLLGNGGSAADALHWAAEMVGRFTRNRPGIPALALVDNPAVVTALANDFGYERVFARQIETLAGPADVVIAISTSGASPSVLAGLRAAADRGCLRIGLTGLGGGAMADLVNTLLDVPSTETARIQEIHALLGHILCELLEDVLFSQSPGDEPAR